MAHVIEHGGDVTVEGAEWIDRADRIEFLDSGMVKLVWKQSYSKAYYPRERVTVETNTSDAEESAEWW